MKLKFIVLGIFLLLLCGCENWNDIYTPYKDILDKGINCEYTLVGNVEMGAGIEVMTLKANNQGIYVSYNHGSDNLIINSNNESSVVHNVNSQEVVYNNFDYGKFLSDYSNTNTCPTNIYIYPDSNYKVDNECPAGWTCFTYSTKSTSGSNQGSSSTDRPSGSGEEDQNPDDDAGKCHVETAIDCKTYRKKLNSSYVYIELGFETLANGSAGRYFIITDQSSLYGGSIGRDSTGMSTVFNNNTYTVWNPEKIYFNNNGTYSYADIEINMTDSGYYNVYFIVATDDEEAIGDYNQGSINEYDPDATPGSPVLEDLEVKPLNFCEQNEVRKTFQIVGYILYIAKILVPLLLIILGTIDFAKATISSDDKAPKEAVVTLIKRILIAIIIFLIPTILSFLLSLVNGATEAFTNLEYEDCTDCLLDPFGDCKAKDINLTN